MKTLRRPCYVIIALAAILPQGFANHGPHCCLPPAASSSLCGIYPTVLTPYDCNGIDVESLRRQVAFQLDNGVHGLLVLGTIGEGKIMTQAEREQVIATSVQAAAAKKAPVVVGIHTSDVNLALAQMQQAKDLGATAVLVKYTGHRRACSATVLSFFAALSESNIIPILYYHFPSDTGLNLPPATIAAILSLPNVIGIKESTFNLREVEQHISLTAGQGKAFFSGTSLNLTQFMKLGGHGAMAPEAAILPCQTVQAYEAYQGGRQAEARSIQEKLFVLTPILRSKAFTSPALSRCALMTAQDMKAPVPMGNDQPQTRMKDALNYLGIATPTYARPPSPALTSADARRVEKTMRRVAEMGWGHASGGTSARHGPLVPRLRFSSEPIHIGWPTVRGPAWEPMERGGN